jgi:hypothetical protein
MVMRVAGSTDGNNDRASNCAHGVTSWTPFLETKQANPLPRLACLCIGIDPSGEL